MAKVISPIQVFFLVPLETSFVWSQTIKKHNVSTSPRSFNFGVKLKKGWEYKFKYSQILNNDIIRPTI